MLCLSVPRATAAVVETNVVISHKMVKRHHCQPSRTAPEATRSSVHMYTLDVQWTGKWSL